ncbi:hypothetical protein [Halovenus salina]|uniref:Rpa-associated protein n=1 Tax=Halovenus salina TaxID=1510225 RepID=A0ABD5W1W9_9EURY|nr:hypothetical protein [Halovenus salina]
MSESEDDGAGQREVAYRLFATEFEDADLSYSAGDDDRSPNYVITPTGARVNRLFAVGVLTEIEPVSDDVLRGRVVDPTGAFVTYAGQYQPDVQAFLERAETPMFVAMTGKARTFQPEDSDQVYSSVRPESINEVDAETRDRWTVQTAEQTLERIGTLGTAIELEESGDALEAALLDGGVSEGMSVGIPLALEHYGTTPTYLDRLRDVALDAARVVADEKDEVTSLDESPDEPGPVSVSEIADAGIEISAAAEPPAGETSQDTSTAEPEGATISDEQASPEQTSEAEVHEGGSETTVSEEETAAAETTTPSQETAAVEPEDEEANNIEDSAETTVVTDETPATESVSDEEPTDSGADEEPVDSGTLDGPGEFDPEEFELEEETRQQVEEEFGTEFQTGTEVSDPGEADIETPAAEDAQEEESETTAPPEETETQADSETAEEMKVDSVDEPDDMQSTVVSVMGELDEGSGASREKVIEEMTERYGVDAKETESAIQDALMDGECYEPDDGTLKPI